MTTKLPSYTLCFSSGDVHSCGLLYWGRMQLFHHNDLHRPYNQGYQLEKRWSSRPHYERHWGGHPSAEHTNHCYHRCQGNKLAESPQSMPRFLRCWWCYHSCSICDFNPHAHRSILQRALQFRRDYIGDLQHHTCWHWLSSVLRPELGWWWVDGEWIVCHFYHQYVFLTNRAVNYFSLINKKTWPTWLTVEIQSNSGFYFSYYDQTYFINVDIHLLPWLGKCIE